MNEKKYIECETLISDLKGLPEQERIEYMGIYDCIKSQPTADVQEVVRCRDCIFGKYDDDLNMILCKRIYNLSDGECVYNDLNDFCSCGAKMNKE